MEVTSYTRLPHVFVSMNPNTRKLDSFYHPTFSWPTAAAWFLFATQFFYGTGHQASLSTIQWTSGTVRVFRQAFTLEDAIGSHACFERAGVLPMAFLSGIHFSHWFTL
jgi:hypothetical protein